MTLGIISALSRQVPDVSSNVNFIQTDAAINPGNSGGPLINLNGEVIGINTAISGRAQNIGFAIPISTAKTITEQLMAKGEVLRPFIGVSMSNLSPNLRKSLGFSESIQGVVVAQVIAGSPAEAAGFLQGDLIQRIDGEKVESGEAIQKLIQGKAIKTTFHMQVLREGKMEALKVTSKQWKEDQRS